MLRFSSFDIVFQEIPDETTLAINLTGCPNHCKGCHSPHLQEDVGEPLTEEVLSKLLEQYGKAITCICFMGGDAEPFEVLKLTHFIKEQMLLPIKIGWYSGKTELPPDFDFSTFDYIKLGPYLEAFGSLKSPESNQRLFRVCEGELTDVTNRFWSNFKQ